MTQPTDNRPDPMPKSGKEAEPHPVLEPDVAKPIAHTGRQRLLTFTMAVFFCVLPLLLQSAHILNRPDNRIVKAGNILYYMAVAIGILYLILRQQRIHKGKPLTGVYARQGLASVWVGISGLMLLSAFAPRFPDSAFSVYLAGAGIIVLYALIPLFLFQYASRKLKDTEIRR